MSGMPQHILFVWRRWLGVRDDDDCPDVDFVIEREYQFHRNSGHAMSTDAIKRGLKILYDRKTT